jgi:hypothetical protein
MNTDEARKEQLFRAWHATTAPFDDGAGLARFLQSSAKPRANVRVLPSALVAAAAVLVCALAWVLNRPTPPLSFSTLAGEGRARAWLATDATRELPLSFSEGTLLVILPDSRGRVEQLGPTGASFLIERGAVHARVVHRSDSDWRFLAGPFEVEVTGTSLDVNWDPSRERFAVHVAEGSVVVRGPNLGAARVVRAGERCEVDLPSHTVELKPRSSMLGVAPDASRAAAPALSESPPLVAPPVASWRAIEARGDHDGAYAAARAVGLVALYRSASADDLLELAQIGQLSGHPASQRDALLACRRRFPGTEQAAVAAYELGRASSSAEAAGWFETYLGERPSAPLTREALGRLVEARIDEGNEAAARKAATHYLARYPDGPHATLARRVLGGARR